MISKDINIHILYMNFESNEDSIKRTLIYEELTIIIWYNSSKCNKCNLYLFEICCLHIYNRHLPVSVEYITIPYITHLHLIFTSFFPIILTNIEHDLPLPTFRLRGSFLFATHVNYLGNAIKQLTSSKLSINSRIELI